MRTIATATLALLARVAADVWPEGILLAMGTILLAVSASFFSPAGPWFVLGAACIVMGVALTLPRAR